MHDDIWEACAIRYATVERRRIENFIFHDLHDAPGRMDYFVWLLRKGPVAVLVDTGFDADAAQTRKREFLRCPIQALGAFGLDPAQIGEVIVTHAHYDHAGNLALLPRAKFHLQEREMSFATGAYMRHRVFRHAYCVDDVCDLVRLLHADRIEFHDGDYELMPGLSVHLIGGHTLGLQVVRVRTRRGHIVLASDAAHYLENLQARSPFPIVADPGQMLAGYERIEALADSDAHIIPGHDPAVMRQYLRLELPNGVEAVSLADPVPEGASGAAPARTAGC